MDLVGWILSIGIVVAISFSTYDMVKEEGGGPVLWSEARLVSWEVLSRTAWAICMCWIIFSIHYGGGGRTALLHNNSCLVKFSCSDFLS